MVENPMLEEVPTEELQPSKPPGKQEEKRPGKGDTWDDQDYEYFFGDYLDDAIGRGRRPRSRSSADRETRSPRPPPCRFFASLWQLSMQTDEPLIREIGEAIIGNLETMGSWSPRWRSCRRWVPADEEVERALKLIQTFDPIGIAARDLQECCCRSWAISAMMARRRE